MVFIVSSFEILSSTFVNFAVKFLISDAYRASMQTLSKKVLASLALGFLLLTDETFIFFWSTNEIFENLVVGDFFRSMTLLPMLPLLITSFSFLFVVRLTLNLKFKLSGT